MNRDPRPPSAPARAAPTCGRTLRGLVVLLAGLPAGCAIAFPAFEPATGDQVQLRFPPSRPAIKATLRMILSIHRMELPAALRIWCRRPGDLRLIAADDLGGTLFHVVWRDGDQTVIQHGAALPAALLTEHIIPDLVRCLTLAPSPGDVPIRDDEGQVGVLRRRGEETVLFRASPDAPRLRRIDVGTAGTLRCTTLMHWREDRPEDIEITNHRAGYRIDLSTSLWQEAALTDGTFRTHRDGEEEGR